MIPGATRQDGKALGWELNAGVFVKETFRDMSLGTSSSHQSFRNHSFPSGISPTPCYVCPLSFIFSTYQLSINMIIVKIRASKRGCMKICMTYIQLASWFFFFFLFLEYSKFFTHGELGVRSGGHRAVCPVVILPHPIACAGRRGLQLLLKDMHLPCVTESRPVLHFIWKKHGSRSP